MNAFGIDWKAMRVQAKELLLIMGSISTWIRFVHLLYAIQQMVAITRAISRMRSC